jgi:hypothetical protein
MAFGGAPGAGKSSDPAAASGLPIRDTAEFHSALLWLRLRRARLIRGSFPFIQPRVDTDKNTEFTGILTQRRKEAKAQRAGRSVL